MDEPLDYRCLRRNARHDLQILPDHLGDERVNVCLVAPAKLLPRLARITDEEINFRRPKIAVVDLNQDAAVGGVNSLLVDSFTPPVNIDADLPKRLLDKTAHRMGLAGREDVVVR